MIESHELEAAQDTAKRLTLPKQKRGFSRQDYGTQWPLVRAVERRWGPISWDLAATAENAKAPRYITPEQDSFTVAWYKLDGLLWLNPPFANLKPWVDKCHHEGAMGAKIILLTPASVGSDWFANYVEGSALVVPLRPRLIFEGCDQAYPKDCMLSLFGVDLPGFESWRWDEELGEPVPAVAQLPPKPDLSLKAYEL